MFKDKYNSLMEKIVKIEESYGCRRGFMYEITLNLNDKKKRFPIDSA